jgi:uncharacterized membrane protein
MDSQTENVAVLEPAISTSAPLSILRMMQALIGRWWVAFALSSICVVSGHLMIKSGLNSVPKLIQATLVERILHVVLQPAVFVGLLVYMFGTACWMIAVSQKEISFLYPLSSVNYVLVVVASALLFAETIPGRRAAGVCLIVAGMFLLNRKSRSVA